MGLLPSKKEKRKDFPCGAKIDTLINQEFCCANPECHKGFTKLLRPHFDHIDKVNTNNSPENCQALCPNCHNNKNLQENKEAAEKNRN